MEKDRKTIKVDEDIHALVIKHTIKTGQKIGKFYDMAVTEKIARETKKPKFRIDYETKAQ